MRAWRDTFIRRSVLALAALAVTVPARAQPAGPPVRVLSADEAVQLAIAHNQTLAAHRLDVEQAKADETTAFLKPNLTFYSANTDFPVFHPSHFTWDNFKSNQSFAEGVSYLFERGGKRRNRLLVAADTTDVTARTVSDAERQLRLDVMQAFIGVLLARSNLDLAKQNLQDFSDVVAVNRQRLASGDIAEADFLKIALQKLQFEQDVSSAQVALVQGKAALRQLVGYDTLPDDYDVAGDLVHVKHDVTLDALKQAALDARPDLQAARSGIKLATDSLALAVSNRAKDVTGNVEYERDGDLNALGFGVAIDLPIHDRNQGEIARTKVAVRQAQVSASAAQIAVVTDVTTAYAAFQTADQVASLYESGYLEQAKQSRDISAYAYQRGATSLLDLLDAERTYRDTQFAFRAALASYMESVAEINFVVGKQVLQ